MSFLLDTNLLSEVRKGRQCDPKVAEWYASIPDAELYLSVIVMGEIRRGIERLRPRDPAQAAALRRWLMTIDATFAGRVLPVDRAVADEWGRLSAIRTIPVADGLLAATAIVHDMTLATPNERNVAGLGVLVVNPFDTGAPP